MPAFEHNRAIWLTFLAIMVLILVIGSYLGYLQATGIPQQPSPPEDAPQAIILEGTYVCLPHADGTPGAECTPGLETAEGAFYALDMELLIDAGADDFRSGMEILVGGIVTPIEEVEERAQWASYDIVGVMRVEEVAEQEEEEEAPQE